MVPIHDSDIAEERWSQAEWENYELWEKVELRVKRQKRLWIIATAGVVLILSALPTVFQRWEKWTTRSLARELAEKINRMKTFASLEHTPFRLKIILGKDGLEYSIEKLKDCAETRGQVIEASHLHSLGSQSAYTWLTPEKGSSLGVPELATEFCYDPFQGGDYPKNPSQIVGFGILPVKDLSNDRLDNLSIVLLTGPSGEVTFE